MAGRRRAADGGRAGGGDRKTARRYVEAAVAAGLARDGGPGQLSDELVGQVAEAVRPVRPGGNEALYTLRYTAILCCDLAALSPTAAAGLYISSVLPLKISNRRRQSETHIGTVLR